MKYYSEKYAEACYPLKHFKSEEYSEGIKLELMKREYQSEYFYCREFDECGDTGEGCGKQCEKYKPRNGKNGRCRFHTNTFEGAGQYFRLIKNKLVPITEREFNE